MTIDDERVPALPRACERCGGELLPIAYGFPGPEMFEAAERGELVLGGCMRYDEQPSRRCRDCGLTTGRAPD